MTTSSTRGGGQRERPTPDRRGYMPEPPAPAAVAALSGMHVHAVDPREQSWEVDAPHYRVYFRRFRRERGARGQQCRCSWGSCLGGSWARDQDVRAVRLPVAGRPWVGPPGGRGPQQPLALMSRPTFGVRCQISPDAQRRTRDNEGGPHVPTLQCQVCRPGAGSQPLARSCPETARTPRRAAGARHGPHHRRAPCPARRRR